MNDKPETHFEIDPSKLLKAQKRFEDFRIGMKTERDKAGATQAFEYCYELAWVLMKRILAARGIQTNSPKETFRKAALEGVIEDPEQWFRFQNIRNLTVHTYEEETQEEVLESFESFSQALKKFVIKLEATL